MAKASTSPIRLHERLAALPQVHADRLKQTIETVFAPLRRFAEQASRTFTKASREALVARLQREEPAQVQRRTSTPHEPRSASPHSPQGGVDGCILTAVAAPVDADSPDSEEGSGDPPSRPADRAQPLVEGRLMRVLLVGHSPTDPAEATLVLGAAAAFNGLRCDGERMPNAHPRYPSLRDLAAELGLHVGSVRRGVRHLVAIGAATFNDGVRVDPVALRERWANPRCRLRLTAEARGFGLRAPALLLVAIVAGQVDRRGRLVLGRRWLAERLGWLVKSGRTKGAPSSKLDAAIRSAERVGAVHHWVIPCAWQMCLALGPSRNREREASRNREREGTETAERREPAKPPIAKPRGGDRETAKGGSRNRESTPDCLPDCLPDQPSGGADRAAPGVETGPEQQNQNPETIKAPSRLQLVLAAPTRTTSPPPPSTTPPTKPTTPEQVRTVVEFWRVEHKLLGVLNANDEMHVAAVAVLLERLGWNQPADLHEGPAARRSARSRELRKATMHDARRVITWSGTADTLCTWILRAVAEHGPENLRAYIRKASSAGDPGTLLHSSKKYSVGRAAETWTDYSLGTEKALEGEHAEDVQRLVAGGAAIRDAHTTDAERVRLRTQLAIFLSSGQHAAAKRVLLQLVGSDRSDVALARATEGICTLAEARRLVA